MNLQNPIWPPYIESISFNTSSSFKAIAFKFCTQCYIHKNFKPGTFELPTCYYSRDIKTRFYVEVPYQMYTKLKIQPKIS